MTFLLFWKAVHRLWILRDQILSHSKHAHSMFYQFAFTSRSFELVSANWGWSYDMWILFPEQQTMWLLRILNAKLLFVTSIRWRKPTLIYEVHFCTHIIQSSLGNTSLPSGALILNLSSMLSPFQNVWMSDLKHRFLVWRFLTFKAGFLSWKHYI